MYSEWSCTQFSAVEQSSVTVHQTGHKAPTDHAVQSNSRAQFSVCITKQGRAVKFEQNAVDYIAVECNILN